MLNLISFMIGISFGSFANVCIYRIPRGLSVVAPGSFCPHCRRTLEWYELIPILSFLSLKGRCRTCGRRIPLRYPLVELASGIVSLYLLSHFGFTLDALFHMALFLLFLIVAVTDWTSLVIPNSLVTAGLIIGIIDFSSASFHALLAAALSAVMAGAFTFIIRATGNLIFKKETMGFGDVKLAVLIGLFIGFGNFLIAVWLAAILGIVYWLVLRIIAGAGRDVRLPFGSFLSLTTLVILFAPGIGKLILN